MANLPATFGPYDITAGDRARAVRLPQDTQYVQFAVDGVYWVRVRLDAATNLLASDAHYVIPPRSIQTLPAAKGMDHIQAISYMADRDMRVAPNPDNIDSEMLITASSDPIPVPVAYAVGLQDSPAAKVTAMATLESLGSPLGTDIIRANGPGDTQLRVLMTNEGNLYLGDGSSGPYWSLGPAEPGGGLALYGTVQLMGSLVNTDGIAWGLTSADSWHMYQEVPSEDRLLIAYNDSTGIPHGILRLQGDGSVRGAKFEIPQDVTSNPEGATVWQLAQPITGDLEMSILDARGQVLGLRVDTDGHLTLGAEGTDPGHAVTKGYVDTAIPPHCEVTANVAQPIPNAVVTELSLTTATSDSDGFFDGGTGRITVPAGLAGRYLLEAEVSWEVNATGDRLLQIEKNGQVIRSQNQNAVSNGRYTRQQTLAPVQLAAGDRVGANVFQTAGDTLQVDSNSVSPLVTLTRLR